MEYGPHKTLYNRWKRWSDKGIFAQIMLGLMDQALQMRTTRWTKAKALRLARSCKTRAELRRKSSHAYRHLLDHCPDELDRALPVSRDFMGQVAACGGLRQRV